MNSDTGQILNPEQVEAFEEIFGLKEAKEKLIPIKDGEMTDKQEKLKQVSKHDNKSVLGKKFLGERRFRRGKYGRI